MQSLTSAIHSLFENRWYEIREDRYDKVYGNSRGAVDGELQETIP